MSKYKTKAKPKCSFELEKYENESYLKNPLLRFRLNEVLERRHYTILKNRATTVSIFET